MIERAVRALGAGAASAVNLLDVEAVVIGGGLGIRLGEPYAKSVEYRFVTEFARAAAGATGEHPNIDFGLAAVGRVLNSKPFVHFGLISYSLYLWQQLWLSHETPAPVWSIPLQVAGAVLCAELSYRFVEVPMLKLRTILKPGRARQEPQLATAPVQAA